MTSIQLHEQQLTRRLLPQALDAALTREPTSPPRRRQPPGASCRAALAEKEKALGEARSALAAAKTAVEAGGPRAASAAPAPGGRSLFGAICEASSAVTQAWGQPEAQT